MSGGIIGVAPRACQGTHARMTARVLHQRADTRFARRLQKKISFVLSGRRTRAWQRNPSRRLDFGALLFIIAASIQAGDGFRRAR